MMSPRTQIHKCKLPNHTLANTVQEFVERHRPEDFPFWVLGCFPSGQGSIVQEKRYLGCNMVAGQSGSGRPGGFRL